MGRFGGQFPRDFADDWLRVGADEAMHFALLDRRLKQLGSHYGAMPAHDGLWEAAYATRNDALARLAIVPMVLEARPGGRWYRDLGNDNGHCWGTVQAIRAPNLLEICGPLMMSFAVASNVQYRLKADGDVTVLTLHHTALGMFPDGYRDALTQGWSGIATRLAARFTR